MPARTGAKEASLLSRSELSPAAISSAAIVSGPAPWLYSHGHEPRDTPPAGPRRGTAVTKPR